MGIWNAPDNSTESEKIDYVYRRLKAKAFEERLNSIWKWSIRGTILYALFQLYLNPGGFLAPFTNGDAKGTITKAISDIATPIAIQMANEMNAGSGGAANPGNVTNAVKNLSPEQKEYIRQELEKRRKNTKTTTQ